MFDERLDDEDELGHKTKYQPHKHVRVDRTCSRKFEKVSDQSRSGASPVEVISWITLWTKGNSYAEPTLRNRV